MSDNTYTGATLEAALTSGKLDESALEVSGMVKTSNRAKHVAVALGNCDTWVDLPIDMIESAERLGSQSCKDHVHPYFKVTLKAPKDDSAKVLASMLATIQVAASSAMVSAAMGASAMARTGSLDVGPAGRLPGSPQEGPFTAAQARGGGPGYPSPTGSWCCTHFYRCATVFGHDYFCCDAWEPCMTVGFGWNGGFFAA
jgi:hypothetical protein